MTPRIVFRPFLVALCALFFLQIAPVQAATVSGETIKWFPITLDFDGPRASETDQNPNPFLDFRLNVTLTAPSGESTIVPGFFAGDGNGNGTGGRIRPIFAKVRTWRFHWMKMLAIQPIWQAPRAHSPYPTDATTHPAF